jgi:segregation and condensation protein A
MITDGEETRFTEGESPSSPSTDEVTLSLFEGPLDLLLYLIQKNEVDIYDIPIARITQQYLEHLDMMRELNLEVAGEFIYTASVLIRIKAGMLLPRAEVQEEEIVDPRSELVAALIEYRKFKQVASQLAEKEREFSCLHPRGDFSSEKYGVARNGFEPELLSELLDAYRQALWRKIPLSDHRVDLPNLTIEDRIDHILDLLGEKTDLPLEALIEDTFEPVVMILTFIAILELARLRKITIFQKGYLDSLWISRLEEEPKAERFEFAE